MIGEKNEKNEKNEQKKEKKKKINYKNCVIVYFFLFQGFCILYFLTQTSKKLL